MPRARSVAIPELFLGLLAIGIAVVLTAHIFSGTIHDVRHTNDTLSVTGSARVPISAKLDALEKATEEAHRRAEILVHGLGGKLGRMRSSSQGVYQVTPRDSTDVSDYGINDTTSREKDVNAVVSVTFAVNR